MSIQENLGGHFAELSRIAYMTEKESRPIAKKMGYTKTKLIDVDGAECLFLENDDTLVLAFRGTEPKEFSDIKADLKAWKRKSRTWGMVHAGFYAYLNKIWESVIRHIEYGDREKKKLYICGHSLGGAMAALAASRLQDRVTACYTYGQPRVGGRVWAKKCTYVHYRYVNNNDIVPRVPFAILGFRHRGALRYINHYGNIRKMTTWQIIKDGWRGRLAAWKKREFFDGARDHSINKYCEKLNHS